MSLYIQSTAWNVSRVGVILVPIFQSLHWIHWTLILRISPYSVRMRGNTDQNNSDYGQFLRSGLLLNDYLLLKFHRLEVFIEADKVLLKSVSVTILPLSWIPQSSLHLEKAYPFCICGFLIMLHGNIQVCNEKG